MRPRNLVVLSFVILLVTAVAWPQTAATVVGVVTDTSGGVVPGATITVTQVETGFARQAQSNDSGVYVVPSLQVGTYSVSAEKSGFKRKTLTGIVLEVNQEARIDLVLEVGRVSETLTVSSEAPLLQTESAAVGQVIDNRYTTQIPLNGRDFSQLILLVPGANTRPGGFALEAGAATGSLGSGVAIGGRDAHNNFMMDGASNNARQFGNIAIKPSIDAIQEFKVQSNTYSAEFGEAAFGQINLVTKSGTNSLHGSVFEFLRNDHLDARNSFLPNKSELRRNEFGTAVGGPIRKDHTFFFANYEGTRERRGVTDFRTVPIDAWRNGDFSGLLSGSNPVFLRDPSLNLPCNATDQSGCFSGNKILTTRFNKTAVAALSLWPKQNFGLPTQATNNLLISRPVEVRDDQFTVKIDHEFSSRDRLTGRYSLADHKDVTTPTLPGFETINPPRNQVGSLALTHVFNPRTLGEFRFSAARSLFKSVSPNTGNVGYFSQFGINHQLAGPQFEGAPDFTFQRITMTTFGDDDFIPLNDISNEFNFAGNLTRTTGNHTLKAGFSITKYQQNTPGAVPGFRRGQFVFRGDFTGHAFADFLLGEPFQSQRVVGAGVETGRSAWHGYYFNDEWKATRKLTLTLGLRYQYISPLVDVHDRRSTFYPLTNALGTGLPGQIIVANSPEAQNLLGLSGRGARALYAPDRNDWAPRFGFAYNLTPKTVVRGGYGFFFTNSQNFVNNFVINRRQPPFAETQVRLSSTTTPQINLSDPFVGAGPPSVVSTQNINPDFREGYVQQWNLTVQHEFPGSISLDVGYVANKGTHLTELPFYNIPLPGDPSTIQARRPFPNWGTALGMASYVTSNYNSLQVKAQKRFSQGLQFLTAYTWSKSIDLSSERGNGDRGGIDGGDPRNLHGYYRGLSGFDIRHRVVFSYVYELPFGHGRTFLKDLHPVADRIIGGWELNGITQFQSGFPFTVLMSGDQNGDGLGGDRPDLIAKPLINPGNPSCYIADPRNPACGPNPTAAFFDGPAVHMRFGTAGRNILNGPGLRNWDISLAKNNRISERFNIQFRAEFFNAFNNVNFNNPQRFFNIAPIPTSRSGFGIINSAGRAREMQFGLKFEF